MKKSVEFVEAGGDPEGFDTLRGLRMTPIKSSRKRVKLKEMTKDEIVRRNSPFYPKDGERENCLYTPMINSNSILERLTHLQENQALKMTTEQLDRTGYSPYHTGRASNRSYRPRAHSRKSGLSRTGERSVDDLHKWLDNKIVRPFQKRLRKLGKINKIYFFQDSTWTWNYRMRKKERKRRRE